MKILYLFKSVQPLVAEKKLVHRSGKVFAETFHVKPDAPKLDKGHPVKFKGSQEGNHRTGIIIRVNPTTYTIEGKRNSEGKRPLYKIPHGEVMSLPDYRKYIEPKRKTDPDKITTEGDRTNAHHNLSYKELCRRKALIEKRLGFTEQEIIKHPSFVGPAIKITSDLAKENGIDPVVRENGKDLWHRAADPDHQELLFNYTMGALMAWRRVLSNEDPKKADVTKENVQQFKEVIFGKRKSSGVHAFMQDEGKSAAIDYLRDMRKRRLLYEDRDIKDLNEDPAARRVLERNSTAPQQLNYTLAANKEGLSDDLKRVISNLQLHEREAVKAKFGFAPYADDKVIARRSNEEVADLLNEKHVKHPETANWNRNHVSGVLNRVLEGIKNSPAKDELSFHYDKVLGRQVWKSQRKDEELEDSVFDTFWETLKTAIAGKSGREQ